MMPDLSAYQPLRQKQLDWFRRHGVPVTSLFTSIDTGNPTAVMVAHGVKAADGRFDDDPSGPAWFVFEEREDVVFWNPLTDDLATYNGRAFALGEDAIADADTYYGDNRLDLHPGPLNWLRAKREGVVIIDWSRAWSRFHDANAVPRIGIWEDVLAEYHRHVRPPKGPEVFVLARERRVAA